MEISASLKTSGAFDLYKVFNKYDAHEKGFLNKTEFKCAFIFITGLKPSKSDMQVIKQFVT